MATETKKKRSTGRPKAEIDWKTVDNLLIAGATGTSIAARFGIHEDTLYLACQRDHNMTFSAYSHQKKQVGNDMILTKQFDVAMKGNVPMLIFLGKARCGQTETQTHEVKMKVEDFSIDGRLTPEQVELLLKDAERKGNG